MKLIAFACPATVGGVFSNPDMSLNEGVVARYCSGCALLRFVDQLKEFCPSLVEALDGVIIVAFAAIASSFSKVVPGLRWRCAFGNERSFP